MTEPIRALPLALLLGPLALGLAAARAAAAGAGADPARCAAIGAASERLACYDASGCAGIAATDERLACYDALANRKSSAMVTAPAPATRPKAAGDDAGSFGLVKPQTPVAP